MVKSTSAVILGTYGSVGTIDSSLKLDHDFSLDKQVRKVIQNVHNGA